MLNAVNAYLPKFSEEHARLQTFKYYRKDCNPQQLAKFGFILLPNNKHFCCFFCSATICSDVTKNSDISAIHLKISPFCLFMKHLLSKRSLRNKLKKCEYLNYIPFSTLTISPFNSDYLDCYNRLKSLENCKTLISKKTISRAGFFFLNRRFYCFQCGTVVSIFSKNDCPWRIHCQKNKHCKYLLASRGFYYIQSNSV